MAARDSPHRNTKEGEKSMKWLEIFGSYLLRISKQAWLYCVWYIRLDTNFVLLKHNNTFLVISITYMYIISGVIYLSVCLSVRRSVLRSVRRSVGPSVRPSVSLSLCPSARPSVRLSVYLSVCLPLRPSVDPLTVCSSVCLPVSLSARPSVCLSVRPPPSVSPFTHTSIHPFFRVSAFLFASLCPVKFLVAWMSLNVNKVSE